LKVCPFCQESLVDEAGGGWKTFDNTKELLSHVAAEYGQSVLFDNRLLRSYLSDHASSSLPQRQRSLVGQSAVCGAVKILEDNLTSDPAHKEIASKQAVQKMVDTYSTAKDAAERIVWEFTNALGWGLPEPQAQPAPQPSSPPPVSSPAASSAPPLAPGTGTLMTRAWQFAEDGDWNEAADYFNKVLDANPSHAPAYVGLICVDLKVTQENKLANCKTPGSITNHKHYKRASADPAVKARLDGFIQTIQARIAAEQKAAVEAARKKRVQDAFDSAAAIMSNAQVPDDYRKAITAFGRIDSNYQDINSQIKGKVAECEARIEEERQKLAKTLKPIKEWETSVYKIQAQSKEWSSQGLCPHCGGKIGITGSCKDCKKTGDSIETPLLRIHIDGIDWRALAVEKSKALLISEKILEKRPYNDENKCITWENCTLREYLNGEFLDKLGTAKSVIAETRNNNPNNPWYGTAGGNATTDKVFLLSLDEVCRYFGDSTANLRRRGSIGSDSTMSDKSNPNRTANYDDRASFWWLRSPGGGSDRAACVGDDGRVRVGGPDVNNDFGGVRPALWLNL
jgi:tetratricopeptide (TPR) repeat protein